MLCVLLGRFLGMAGPLVQAIRMSGKRFKFSEHNLVSMPLELLRAMHQVML